MDFFNPDETLCDCGHPRKLHSISCIKPRVPCMFRDPKTDEPHAGPPCPHSSFPLVIFILLAMLALVLWGNWHG